MRIPKKLPCYGGPLDGQKHEYGPLGLVAFNEDKYGVRFKLEYEVGYQKTRLGTFKVTGLWFKSMVAQN